MIRTQKKVENLRKTKSKSRFIEVRTFSLLKALKSGIRFVRLFKLAFILWCMVNLALLYIFRLIPNGWTNSLSILWLVSYYVFWSVFIRYIQQHQPYFSLVRIFNALIPTSKIMFINISICILLKILPYIPFFMGFRERYLEFFENYMAIITRPDSFVGTSLFYILMLLISPYTITRPLLAYISSLIGKNRSIMNAYQRTKGNYWGFVLLGFIMSSLCIFFYYIDTSYKLDTTIYLMSVLPLYFSVVFLNIYKAFYKRKAKVKLLAQ